MKLFEMFRKQNVVIVTINSEEWKVKHDCF